MRETQINRGRQEECVGMSGLGSAGDLGTSPAASASPPGTFPAGAAGAMPGQVAAVVRDGGSWYCAQKGHPLSCESPLHASLFLTKPRKNLHN